MLPLLALLATLTADPLTSNREGLRALERASDAHGSEAGMKLSLAIRGDVINESQSLTPLAPFETYPFAIDVKIDQAAKRVRAETRSAIAGDFHFTDVILLDGGKGYVLTPEIKACREITSEPPVLNRFLPHRLIQQALQNRASVRSFGDGIVSFATSNGQVMALELDRESGLLRRVEQVGPHGIFGDGVRETLYEHYKRTGALMLPSVVRVRSRNSVHGGIENVYRYENARADATFDASELALPEGYAKGDWSYRENFGVKSLAKDVYLLENISNATGQWSYNVLVVAFDEFVLVAEAPVGSDASEKVLAKIKELAPGKPVRYLVQSHHHGDHLGGIRPYIADGVTILAGPTLKPFLEKIAAAPFSLEPDRLQRAPRAPLVEMVSEPRTIRDANHALVIYNIGPNPHARDMLIVHLPKEKILWQSDMINDGEYPENASTRDFAKKVEALGLKYENVVGLHGRSTSN